MAIQRERKTSFPLSHSLCFSLSLFFSLNLSLTFLFLSLYPSSPYLFSLSLSYTWHNNNSVLHPSSSIFSSLLLFLSLSLSVSLCVFLSIFSYFLSLALFSAMIVKERVEKMRPWNCLFVRGVARHLPSEKKARRRKKRETQQTRFPTITCCVRECQRDFQIVETERRNGIHLEGSIIYIYILSSFEFSLITFSFHFVSSILKF